MIQEFQGEYRFLSNFWYADIELYSRRFDFPFYAPTNEHAYQASKANNIIDFLDMLTYETPKGVKLAGRNIILREDWETIKIDVMYRINLAKYIQHKDLRKLLLETGNQYLIEGNYWKDIFWGIDLRSGIGENHLGKILMQIRRELR